MIDKVFKRKLTAIFSADVQGYSRLMGEDEEATVRMLMDYREVLTTLIQQSNGRVIDSPGDNMLAEFASVVDAVQCAVVVQKKINARNDGVPENRRMHYRIGINLDIFIDIFTQKISSGRRPRPREITDWMTKANPFKLESDAEHMIQGIVAAGLKDY